MTRDQPVPLVAASDVEVPPTVLAYFEAINSEAWESLAELWNDTSELHAVGTRPRRGRDEILDYFNRAFAPWTAHADTPTRFIVSEMAVAVEIRFKGETESSRVIEFDAIDVFDLGPDGTISRLSSWYDLAWVRTQLR